MDGLAQVQSRIAEIQTAFTSGMLAPRATSAVGSASFADALQEAQATDATSEVATSTTANENSVVAEARKYLGVPYVWGGTDPKKGLDCSGLTQLVFKNLGIDIPRVSKDQARVGTHVDGVANARPGDLVFYDYSSSRNGIDHVGIYIGNGKIINAPKPGDVVKIADVGSPVEIRRVLPASTTNGTVATGAAASTKTGDFPYADLFAQAAARYGVPATLLAAVAKTESNFNPRAVSSAGAEGLMQMMPATAKSLGVNSFDPASAINGAAKYLATHLRDFGTVDKALAAYNAGPGAVRKYGGIPPYAETQNYVRKVNAAWDGYR